MYPTNGDYDTDLQEKAIRLMAARTSKQSAAAARCLLSTSAAGRQMRLDRIIPEALDEDCAEWTADERALLVSAMWFPGSFA